ncbi:MAG: hypothetical protein WC470_02775 [Candidatus Paceibacterota bacterium]
MPDTTATLNCESKDSKAIPKINIKSRTVKIPEDKKVLSIMEIRKYFHVSPKRIHGWIKQGLKTAPAVRGIRIYRKTLKEYHDKSGEFIILPEKPSIE